MPELPTTPVDKMMIEAGLKKLRGLLAQSADMELTHIRPFTVTQRWRTER